MSTVVLVWVGLWACRLSAGIMCAVVIACRFNGIRHLQIYDEGGLFGFSSKCPGEFGTLEELVVHYSMNDLSRHNKDLNTTLRVPVGSGS